MLRQSRLLAFQLQQERLNLLLALEQGKAIFTGLSVGQRVRGEVGGLLRVELVADLRLQSSERSGAAIDRGAAAVELSRGARTAMLRKQEFAARARFGELRLELGERGAEQIGLGTLIINLLGETLGQLHMVERTIECGASEIVLALPTASCAFVRQL